MQSLRPKRVGSEDPSGGARSANGVKGTGLDLDGENLA